MTPSKSLAEHRAYLEKSVRLQLWFLPVWLASHPAEHFTDALRQRVDIYRKTDFFSGNDLQSPDFANLDWVPVEAELNAIYERNIGFPERFEEEGYSLLASSIGRRAPLDFQDHSHRDIFPDGFLRTNPAIYPSHPGILTFHIFNTCEPDSFFDSPDYMRECFRRMLDCAEQEIHAERIGTETWLNDLEKWLVYFPPSWREHLERPITDVKWHNGFWGQFINRRGCFNDKAGQTMRRLGHLPHYPRFSWCEISDFREFLEA